MSAIYWMKDALLDLGVKDLGAKYNSSDVSEVEGTSLNYAWAQFSSNFFRPIQLGQFRLGLDEMDWTKTGGRKQVGRKVGLPS